MSRQKSMLKGKTLNKIQMKFPSLSVNEAIARASVAVFVSQLDPEITELTDIKCAVSEAVTNCIVHGYRGSDGFITVTVSILEGRVVKIEIKDKGCGISDIQQARQPLFTTDAAGERSGMGFTVMESFMTAMKVNSKVGVGTTVTLYKRLGDYPNLTNMSRRRSNS